MFSRRLLCPIMFVVIAVSQACADSESMIIDIGRDLKSGNKAREASAKSEIERSRQQLLSACTNVFARTNQVEVVQQWATRDALRNHAIELLGRMQAEEAIDLLLENLAQPKGVPKTSWPFHDYPPSVEALARIGKPVVPKVLRKMASSVDQDTLRGLGLVLIHVEGYEGGKKLLESRIAEEKDSICRQNLERARDRYLRLPKKLPPPGYDD